jgi:hypothetical protein
MERAEMIKFKQFVEIHEEVSVDEALNVQQRMKLKQALRRNKAKIQLGRKRSMRRMASAEVLKGRALKQAKNLIVKKILKNKQKGDLSYGSRVNLEKQVAKRKNAILRLAKKLLPKVRQKDRTKLQNKEK